MTEITRADRVVVVPRKAASARWSADDAQEWARNDVLAGGPPAPPEDPSTGETLKWSRIKEMAGRQVRIRAQPMGLIVSDSSGRRRYVPGDATTGTGGHGITMGTSVREMRARTQTEGRIRTFCQAEVARYNKSVTARERDRTKRSAASLFWESGRRVRDFLSQNPDVSQDAVWFSLEQWGRGASGYGKNWLEYATYFYDWIPTAGSDHPAFVLSETRIMNIVRASKDPLARERLLQASLVGDFASLSDEEFKWTTGQSLSTFPLEQDVLAALMRAGVEVMQTGLLGPETKRSFLETLHGLRTSRLKSSKSEVEDDEDQ